MDRTAFCGEWNAGCADFHHLFRQSVVHLAGSALVDHDYRLGDSSRHSLSPCWWTEVIQRRIVRFPSPERVGIRLLLLTSRRTDAATRLIRLAARAEQTS